MFRDFVIGSCTLTIGAMQLHTYLNHGNNFPTLISIILALIATGLSFSALVRRQVAAPAK
jgi:hypothetical protein